MIDVESEGMAGYSKTWKRSTMEQQRASVAKFHRTPRNHPINEHGSASSVNRLHVTSASNLSVNLDTHCREDGENQQFEGSLLHSNLPVMANVSGNFSDQLPDEVDGHIVDQQKTRLAIEQLQAKILRTDDMIKSEQKAKQENVNEYLRLSNDADRQQVQRIKTVFEKKNLKSTQTIAQLQRKLEDYNKRLKDVETNGVTSHKQAKDVLKDVGHGLKEFFAREPIRSRDASPIGIRDQSSRDTSSVPTKSKELISALKNRFGSADNIARTSSKDISQTGDEKFERVNHASGNHSIITKEPSDEEASSIISDSIPSGEFNNSKQDNHHILVHTPSIPSVLVRDSRSVTDGGHQHHTDPSNKLSSAPSLDLTKILAELQECQQTQTGLQSNIDSLKSQLDAETIFYRQSLDEEHDRCERLEEQINDLSELHQHEIHNIKQELASMQEKMEYQLDERTRDMQDLLLSCQTKITKMELQQQQQQLISMEGIENTNFRALITKLINVMLAMLAVVLVLVSTVANLIGPFLTSRFRILSTVFFIAAIALIWNNWSVFCDFVDQIVEKYYSYTSS